MTLSFALLTSRLWRRGLQSAVRVNIPRWETPLVPRTSEKRSRGWPTRLEEGAAEASAKAGHPAAQAEASSCQGRTQAGELSSKQTLSNPGRHHGVSRSREDQWHGPRAPRPPPFKAGEGDYFSAKGCLDFYHIIYGPYKSIHLKNQLALGPAQ